MAKFLDSTGVTSLVGLLDKRYKLASWEPAEVTLESLGVTATAAELNKLDGVTVGSKEFNFLSNLSGNVQTQLDSKQVKLKAGTGIDISSDTISCTIDTTLYKVVEELPESPAPGDENKIHLVPDDNGSGQNVFTEYLWNAEGSKWEILGESSASTEIPLANITDLNSSWDALLKAAPSEFVTRWPQVSEVTGLSDALAGKSDTNHKHTSADITALTGYVLGTASAISASDTLNAALGKLQASINDKAPSSHTHQLQQISNLNVGWSKGILDAAPNESILASVAELNLYNQGSDATPIASTDTINEAFAKLQNQINTKADASAIPEIPDIEITGGNAESGKYISAISASGHTITVTKTNLPNGVANALTLEVSSTKDSSTSVTFDGSAPTTFTIGIMSNEDIEAAVSAVIAG